MRVEHGRGGKGKLRPPGCSQQEVGSRCMRAGPVWWAVGSVGSELILVVFLVAPGAHLLLEGRGAWPPGSAVLFEVRTRGSRLT